MAVATTPDYTGYVDQRFFLAPLGGPQNPVSYLDRFPDEIYNKSVDSHLVRLMYTLLGPAGTGWLRKNYLQARLILEASGLSNFDLDDFYGNPFAFGRILDEVYENDPHGLLNRVQWEQIRSKDAKYRSRAIDFMNAARAGGTLKGITLAAKSGLGQPVEVIENYKYIYDQLSDDPLGLEKVGATDLTGEAIILPRYEVSTSEVQTLTMTGSPTGGTFTLAYPYGNARNGSDPVIGSFNSTPVVNNWTTGDESASNVGGAPSVFDALTDNDPDNITYVSVNSQPSIYRLTNNAWTLPVGTLARAIVFEAYSKNMGSMNSTQSIVNSTGSTTYATTEIIGPTIFWQKNTAIYNLPTPLDQTALNALNLHFQIRTGGSGGTGNHAQSSGWKIYVILVANNDEISTTDPITFDATAAEIQDALEGLKSIGQGNVFVTGGPFPTNPIYIRFGGELSNQDVPTLIPTLSLTGGTDPSIDISVSTSDVQTPDETINIAPIDMHYMLTALDRIRPITMIPTVAPATGVASTIQWGNVTASSEFTQVVRYVTGSNTILWPERSGFYWIEPTVEHEAPITQGSERQHYQGFHNIISVDSYTEEALNDAHYEDNDWADYKIQYRDNLVGPYSTLQQQLFPSIVNSHDNELTADRIPADYPELLTVQSVSETNSDVIALINGIYPTEYQGLSGVPGLRYTSDQFWASKERDDGTDYIEIDLGTPQAINYITFEMSQKPFNITIDYDTLGMGSERLFLPVTPEDNLPYNFQTSYTLSTINPWQVMTFNFTDSRGDIIFTRFIRIGFERRYDFNSPFLLQDGTHQAYSAEIKNLRLGRNIA